MEYPDGRNEEKISPAGTMELEEITKHLQYSLKEIPGILFEEKGLILSVHYRNVDEKLHPRIPPILTEELRQWKDRWRMASGKMVLEIMPKVDFHKGQAVRDILATVPCPEFLPIYLGDDKTDEDAFRVLKGQGISVFVGPASSLSEADFFLQDPVEVREFLSRCKELRQGASR
jgi:trehalose 6-phosphate phosphatase